jgi:hypothetical protein
MMSARHPLKAIGRQKTWMARRWNSFGFRPDHVPYPNAYPNQLHFEGVRAC